MSEQLAEKIAREIIRNVGGFGDADHHNDFRKIEAIITRHLAAQPEAREIWNEAIRICKQASDDEGLRALLARTSSGDKVDIELNAHARRSMADELQLVFEAARDASAVTPPQPDEVSRLQSELATHGKTCTCGHKKMCEDREEWLVGEIRRLSVTPPSVEQCVIDTSRDGCAWDWCLTHSRKMSECQTVRATVDATPYLERAPMPTTTASSANVTVGEVTPPDAPPLSEILRPEDWPTVAQDALPDGEYTFEQLRTMARLPLLPAHLSDYYAAVKQLFAVLTERRAAPLGDAEPLTQDAAEKSAREIVRQAAIAAGQQIILAQNVATELRIRIAAELLRVAASRRGEAGEEKHG